eukprot:COSAG06_NODE_4834_length_3921_cov_7.706960_2_plen_54_part_00
MVPLLIPALLLLLLMWLLRLAPPPPRRRRPTRPTATYPSVQRATKPLPTATTS